MRSCGDFPRKFMIALLAGFLAFALALLLKSCLFPSGAPDPKSSAAALTPRGVDETVGGSGSEEYNQMIEELNRAGAQTARESGESFVDIPTGAKTEAKPKEEAKPSRPVLEMPPQPQGKGASGKGASEKAKESEIDQKEKPEKPVSKAPEKTEAEKAQADQEASDALLSDLKSLPNPAPGPWVVRIVDSGGESPKKPEDSSEGSQAALASPGQILYAVTSLAVNSDVSSPVLATVVQGEMAGFRLLGAFQRDGELLSIAFDKMISPDGSEVAVKAVAVDSRSNSPAVSGKVDSHFLERWGALMAASFLEGLGEAMSGRGTTIRSDGDLIVSQREGASLGEISVEALGKVGSRAAGRLERGFDRPPTVILPSGSAIGVLVIEAGSGGKAGSRWE